MIIKTMNPGASATNTVVVSGAACCGEECTECEYRAILQDFEPGRSAIFFFKNADGIEKSITLDYDAPGIIKLGLVDFLLSIGFYVENPVNDIYINISAQAVLTVSFFGFAELTAIGIKGSGGVEIAQKLCNSAPTCDYGFMTPGSEDPVPVSLNGVDGTVPSLIPTDSEAHLTAFLATFFTTASSIDVTINDAQTEITIVLHGYLPNDLIYIDGQEGIKSNCRKVFA